MAEITSQMVKSLREKTGAGMADCKNALLEANGDMQSAIEILRKKGAASAAKRLDREAKEGVIATAYTPDHKRGVIVEVNCETDFVSRNENFVNYASIVAKTLLENNVNSVEELFNSKVGSDTLGGIHNEILSKFQENIQIRRYEVYETNGYIAEYVHAGNKLGVIVEFQFDKDIEITDSAKQTFREIAMQIAAMNPMFISRDDVSPETIEKELAIYKEHALTEGKKPEIVERIAKGKLEKFFQEQCLIEQTFVKDGSKSVKDVLTSVEQEVGAKIKIARFKRYFLGEIEQ
ncbi:MAG: translation elongation factor Ts [Candidatus Kapaibacteriales bacterium]